jgi:ferredoxin
MITPPPECRVSGPENTTITCHPGETLLDAWLRQGVAARFSCRGGSCHTCMLRCVAGELPDRAQQGIPLRLQEKGYFLPCLCVPTGPLEVAPVVPDDFITDCVVESQKRIPVGWLVCLEPITAYPAEPGQYTCLRLASPADAETQLPWITPWRVENRQEEDFYLHLVFAFPADAPPRRPWQPLRRERPSSCARQGRRQSDSPRQRRMTGLPRISGPNYAMAR